MWDVFIKSAILDNVFEFEFYTYGQHDHQMETTF